MNRTKLLLRIAAGLMLIHLVGHSIGHSGWKKSNNPLLQEVISQMTGPKFPFMGVTRSMGEYFDGYGYAVSIGMIIFILILWSISGELETSPRLAKKAMLAIGVCLFAWGIDEVIFFFPFAAANSLIAFVCTIAAYISFKPREMKLEIYRQIPELQ
jgi:hypothetical protein